MPPWDLPEAFKQVNGGHFLSTQLVGECRHLVISVLDPFQDKSFPLFLLVLVWLEDGELQICLFTGGHFVLTSPRDATILIVTHIVSLRRPIHS